MPQSPTNDGDASESSESIARWNTQCPGSVTFLALLVAIAGCASLPPTIPGGSVAPLESGDEKWLVRGHVDGHPAVFVLDTGATITSLTTAAARRFSIRATDATTINAQYPAGTATVGLEVGGLVHEPVRVAIVDMPLAAELGARIDGIIGLDVLGQHDIVIDFARRTLALHAPGTLVRQALPQTVTRVHFRRGQRGVIELPATLAGATLPAVLDLGSSYNLTNGTTATANVHIGTAAVSGRFFPLDGEMFVRLGYVDRPALVIGSGAFEGRMIAIAYRDQIAFISD